MKISISEIKINPGRRTAAPVDVHKLAESMTAVGLMHPVTVDENRVLIAGLHRLEAAKLLGWTEIECSICPLDELHAELAEIDENYVRANLTPLQASQLLLRRKELYETLYPETKAGAAQGNGMKRNADGDLTDNLSARQKSFAQDAAEMLGVNERTVRRQIKIAQDLTPEAQKIIGESGVKVTQQALDQISRLAPEHQTEAAEKLVNGADQTEVVEPAPASDDGTMLQDFISDFLSGFRRYSEDFVLRAREYGDAYDDCAEHLDGEEQEALKSEAGIMLDAMRALYEKIVNVSDSEDGDTDKNSLNYQAIA